TLDTSIRYSRPLMIFSKRCTFTVVRHLGEETQISEGSASILAAVRVAASERTDEDALMRCGRLGFDRDRREKKCACRAVHSESTSHPQLFHSLDAAGSGHYAGNVHDVRFSGAGLPPCRAARVAGRRVPAVPGSCGRRHALSHLPQGWLGA